MLGISVVTFPGSSDTLRRISFFAKVYLMGKIRIMVLVSEYHYSWIFNDTLYMVRQAPKWLRGPRSTGVNQ